MTYIYARLAAASGEWQRQMEDGSWKSAAPNVQNEAGTVHRYVYSAEISTAHEAIRLTCAVNQSRLTDEGRPIVNSDMYFLDVATKLGWEYVSDVLFGEFNKTSSYLLRREAGA